MNALSQLCEYVLGQREVVITLQKELCASPALAPQNGGKGEMKKAALLEKFLKNIQVEYFRSDSPDAEAEECARPNIVARIPGKSAETLWIFAHMDVVPAGDLTAWHSDPWQAHVDGDFIYGRGVEDNQQAIVSMLVLADALRQLNLQPETGLGLVFMADEECGSRHGMQFLLEKNREVFSGNDYYIVPDGGSPSGDEIEIAEKAQLWLKFIVTGKQAHASMPGKGQNAFVAASQLVIALQSLHRYFPQRNELFEPPFSTFVATRHEENVPAINILPGKDIFYLDCRLLPEVNVDEALARARAIANEVAFHTGVNMDVEIVSFQPASMTSPDAPIVRKLEKAIGAVYGVKARPVGIGGATVASFLRRANLPAAVWCRIAGTCHQPNEKSSISGALNDAAVFAHLLFSSEVAHEER